MWTSTKQTVNGSETGNVLNREFNQKRASNDVISDLSYVRVAQKWNYIRFFIDLFNREIIGLGLNWATVYFDTSPSSFMIRPILQLF